MRSRPVGRAGALAAVGVLLLSGTALADTVAVDGDLVTAGIQTFVDLGTVAPGATVNQDVNLTMFCAGLRHVDPGQIVTVAQSGSFVPAEGGSITGTSTTIGPVPPEWANDTGGVAGCPGPLWVEADGPSHVTIVAPTTVGSGYFFTLTYGRTLSPAGVSDGSSTTSLTSVTFELAVGDTDSTPPTFTSPPADIEVTTADPAGVAVGWATPTATDDRDPQPAVTCDPASGSTFPIGTSNVTCTATDASGNSAEASFNVTVHLASVAWDDPVHGTEVSATRGRNVPVKVRAWLDGAAFAGTASLVITDCGAPGAVEGSVELTRQSDRWMAGLDTSMLNPGCHQVWLVANGLVLDAFHLEVVAPPKTASAQARGANRPK